MRTAQPGDQVSVHYVKRSENGGVVSSRGRAPLVLTVGTEHRRLPGLATVLVGRCAGERIKLQVPAEQAYGVRRAERVRRLSRARFQKGHDLTVGSRYVAGGSVTNWSRARVALSRGANAYSKFMLGLPIHDATSGYRVYRRALLEELLRTPFAGAGYVFQIELVMRSDREGFDVAEVPITFREREHGESKISRSIVVEALWMVTRWGLSARLGRGPAIRTGRSTQRR